MRSEPGNQAPDRALRVGLNAATVEGPFGGANRFTKCLIREFQKAGCYVTTRLEPGLDVLFIIISHDASRVTFSPEDAAAYKKVYPGTVVIQRINVCDESRGTNLGQNTRILFANRIADHTIFVSDFIRRFWAVRGIADTGSHSTILTGADEEIFHSQGGAVWDGSGPFRLVTHHWSSNFLKGFDVYQRLDQMLGRPPWQGRFEFTYIGNIPAGFRLRNTRHIPPADGEELADLLRAHHGYVTAARLEAGGNHYLEAMQCGLPVLHLDDSSLPEYCADYGITFDLVNFAEKLEELRDRYVELRAKVLSCPYGARRMATAYVDLTRRLTRSHAASIEASYPLAFRLYLFRKRLNSLRRRVGNRLAR